MERGGVRWQGDESQARTEEAACGLGAEVDARADGRVGVDGAGAGAVAQRDVAVCRAADVPGAVGGGVVDVQGEGARGVGGADGVFGGGVVALGGDVGEGEREGDERGVAGEGGGVDDGADGEGGDVWRGEVRG